MLFVALEVVSYTRESATYDEPVHVTNGYFSLALGDYRVDPEHPPFLRMWSALPLMTLSAVNADPRVVDVTIPEEWALGGGLFTYAHRFMYVDNDADRMLYLGRMMTVLLGLLLGGLLYSWAFEWFGWTTAAAVLAIYTLEPNLSAHARLVTTDFGVTCFMFGAIFFLWRTVHDWRPANIACLAVCVALSVISKFSGLILAPIIGCLIVAVVIARQLTPRRAVVLVVLLAATSVTTIWAIYGFRYLPSASPDWQSAFHAHADALERVPTLGACHWVDRRASPSAERLHAGLLAQPGPGATSQCVSRRRIHAGRLVVHFPVAVALKTPLTLLLLAAFGAVTCLGSRKRPGLAFVVVPIAVYLGWSMTARINIGVRHVLPIYPFLIMLAALAIDRLIVSGRRYIVAAAVGLCMWKPARRYPHTGILQRARGRTFRRDRVSRGFESRLGPGPQGAQILDRTNTGSTASVSATGATPIRSPTASSAPICRVHPAGSMTRYCSAPVCLDTSPSVRRFCKACMQRTKDSAHYRRLLSHTPIAIIGHSKCVYLDRQW